MFVVDWALLSEGASLKVITRWEIQRSVSQGTQAPRRADPAASHSEPRQLMK